MAPVRQARRPRIVHPRPRRGDLPAGRTGRIRSHLNHLGVVMSQGTIRMSIPFFIIAALVGVTGQAVGNEAALQIRGPAPDFDGDGRADRFIVDPVAGNWYVLPSSGIDPSAIGIPW